ncbi:MAG: M48 family metallopeptidase [Polyangiaceae bacterium]|nr:M48 family metallopeptidase [Polyangiaceae bacterium]
MDLAAAKDVLRRFLAPGADTASLLRALRPERRDYAEVFVQAAVEAAVATYEPAWNGGALGVRTQGAVDVELWGATTDELRSGDAPAAKSFAPEWRTAARHLQRGLTFHGFRFVDAAGHAVGGGDGLVATTAGWRWFPSPALAVEGLPAPPPEPEPATPPVTSAAAAPAPGTSAAAAPAPATSAAAAPAPATSVAAAPVSSPTARAHERIAAHVFAGDRELRAELDASPLVARLRARLDVEVVAARARRELLERGVRIARTLAPDLHRVVDLVKERLGLDLEVEIYTGHLVLSPAAALPPTLGRVPLVLAPLVLESCDHHELRFILGHELAHVALGHHALTPKHLEGSPEVDVRLTARLFSWLRYAELSADRVGLACAGSFEAAASALLKMTTGLQTQRWVKGGAELARQYAELATLGTEQSPQLWFETHPFSPLRLKSLELFARSAPLAEFLGHMGAQLSAAELEREVRQIMAWMDPVLPRASAPEALRRFASFAGALVMLSDGATDPPESALLARIGTAELLGEVAEALRSGAGALRRALAAAAAAALLLASRAELVKLVEEVASMAMVTGGASEPERQVLRHAAELLRLEPGVVDAALARLGRGLD